MATIFCPVCGCKSEYKFATPNFCYKCGSAYNQSAASSYNLNKNYENNNNNGDSDEDDGEDDGDMGDFSNSTRVPRISRLQVEIDASTDVRVVKFEDLLNSNSISEFKKPKNLDLG